jgi:hypothetical protein
LRERAARKASRRPLRLVQTRRLLSGSADARKGAAEKRRRVSHLSGSRENSLVRFVGCS